MEEPEVTSSVPPPPVIAGGLADNVAGALAYITILPAILFLVLEPYNRRPFIRFHSFQCLALAVVWVAVSLLSVIPLLGWLLGVIAMIVLFCVWILCIVKAYQGIRFKLPILGDFVENLAK